MNSKKVFQLLFFSLIIAGIDFLVYRFLGDFRLYNLGISLFLTHLVYVFMAAKIGGFGVSLVHALFRVAFFFLVTPYPCETASLVLAAGILGEIIMLFVKKKRTFLPNSIVYFVFYLIYVMRDYFYVHGGIGFDFAGDKLIQLGITGGVLLGSYLVAFILSRMILMPKLRRAGIEK